ncbi:MAG: DNA gyrase inhibitor YacG [Kiloniellales bacterium]|nr:DNA gyrase inhibitor YacG [Kiloniellales bacterium]
MSRDSNDESDKVVPLSSRRRQAVARCPICGKPATAQASPFCSRRCANIDLGHWLDGSYRIPTEEAPEEGMPPDPEDG